MFHGFNVQFFWLIKFFLWISQSISEYHISTGFTEFNWRLSEWLWLQQMYSPQTSILIVNGAKYSPQYSNLHIQMLLPTHFLNVRFYLPNWLVALNFPYNIGSSLETKALLVLISTDDGLLFGIILCCVDIEKLTKNRHKRNIWVLMRPTISRMRRALHKMAQSNFGSRI